MAVLVAIPILVALTMLQSAVAVRIQLLHGTVDLVLLALIAWALQKRVTTAWQWTLIGGLLMGYLSGLPLGTHLLAYSLVVGITIYLRRRVWQAPLLALVVATLIGVAITHTVTIAALWFGGSAIPLGTIFNLFTMPSLILNLVFAFPTFALLGDLANWLYPEELEV
jgi:rod shape-determining protein MreD